MNETARILCAIGSQARCSLETIIEGMGDKKPTTAAGVSVLISTLEAFESTELLRLYRYRGKVIGAELTPLGAERAREAQEAQ